MCEGCGCEYEVIKSITEYSKAPAQDKCPICNKIGYRVFSCNIQFTGTKIEDAEYNPALGMITKSKRHRDEIAKRKGLIEIGNENPETIHKHFDKSREEARKKSWESI